MNPPTGSIQVIQCLSWLQLSAEDREMILDSNKSKVSIRTIECPNKGKPCNDERHTANDGNIDMYSFRRHETNVTIHHDHVREHSMLHQGTDSAVESEHFEKQHIHQNDGDNPNYNTVGQHSILQEWSINREGKVEAK